MSKISKISKDEDDLEILKDFLQSKYKIIRELYKLYAGV